MKPLQKNEITDPDIRHFIYSSFEKTSRPPTSLETAQRFQISIAAVEESFKRLAENHHIALAPGSCSVWMAHPFSGLPTNHVARVENQIYWGN